MRFAYNLDGSFSDFPNKLTVTDFASLLSIAKYNHCLGEYNQGKRSLEAFVGCDAIVMDVDNDGDTVYTPQDVERIIPAKSYVVYSRHHMRQKGDKPPLPRYHVYYPLSRVYRSADEVAELKRRLCAMCPAFDPAAVDASRLIFGVSEPAGYESNVSTRCVDEYVSAPLAGFKSAVTAKDTISSGSRNVTLFKAAIRVLSTYSTSDALKVFQSEAAKCIPPLDKKELTQIWKNALKYVAKDAVDAQVSAKKRQKPRLTMRDLEAELSARGVVVKYDIVTKQLLVSEFPTNGLPAQYGKLTPEERALHRAALLQDYLDGELAAKYGFTRDLLASLISNLGRINRCCSPLDLISAAPWDGQERFDKLCDLITPDLSVDVPWRMYVRKWMLQSVALLHNTVGHIGGDVCLVLQGAQGIRKTSFFRRLALRGEWFREGQVLDMRNKDLIIQAVSRWITELGELDSTLVKEQSALKAFLTANQDVYRLPYARLESKTPRVTSFCATVNPREFLRDMTGSRRFLVIPVTEISREIFDLSDEFFLGVWREVLNWYRLGEDWRLDDTSMRASEVANETYRTTLPYEDDIYQLCDFEAPLSDWSERNAAQMEAELGLMGEARRVGRALAALSRRDSRIQRRVGHGRVAFYLLPPLHKLTTNSPQTHHKLTDTSLRT